MPALRSDEFDDFEPLITMTAVERGAESAPIVRAPRPAPRTCWFCGPANVIVGGHVINRSNDPSGDVRMSVWPLLNRAGHDPGDEDRA